MAGSSFLLDLQHTFKKQSVHANTTDKAKAFEGGRGKFGSQEYYFQQDHFEKTGLDLSAASWRKTLQQEGDTWAKMDRYKAQELPLPSSKETLFSRDNSAVREPSVNSWNKESFQGKSVEREEGQDVSRLNHEQTEKVVSENHQDEHFKATHNESRNTQDNRHEVLESSSNQDLKTARFIVQAPQEKTEGDLFVAQEFISFEDFLVQAQGRQELNEVQVEVQVKFDDQGLHELAQKLANLKALSNDLENFVSVKAVDENALEVSLNLGASEVSLTTQQTGINKAFFQRENAIQQINAPNVQNVYIQAEKAQGSSQNVLKTNDSLEAATAENHKVNPVSNVLADHHLVQEDGLVEAQRVLRNQSSQQSASSNSVKLLQGVEIEGEMGEVVSETAGLVLKGEKMTDKTFDPVMTAENTSEKDVSATGAVVRITSEMRAKELADRKNGSPTKVLEESQGVKETNETPDIQTENALSAHKRAFEVFSKKFQALGGSLNAGKISAAQGIEGGNILTATDLGENLGQEWSRFSIHKTSGESSSFVTGIQNGSNSANSSSGTNSLPRPQVGAQAFDLSSAQGHRDEIRGQIAMSFGQMRGGFKDRIEIQLKPQELGRVEVRIEVGHDGRTQVIVATERTDVGDMLRQDARFLADQMKEAGIDLSESDISYEQGNFQNESQAHHDLEHEKASRGLQESAKTSLSQAEQTLADINLSMALTGKEIHIPRPGSTWTTVA